MLFMAEKHILIKFPPFWPLYEETRTVEFSLICCMIGEESLGKFEKFVSWNKLFLFNEMMTMLESP